MEDIKFLYCTNKECKLNKDNKCTYIPEYKTMNRQIICEERITSNNDMEN